VLSRPFRPPWRQRGKDGERQRHSMVNRSLRKRIANHESFAAFHAEGGLRRWRSRVSMAVIDAHDSLPRDRIANTMSDADQHEINTETAAGGNTAGSGQELPVSKFEVLPYGEPTNEKELFSFREAIPAPVQPAAPQKRNPPLPAAKVFILIALLAAAAFIAFALYMTLRPKPPAAYVDLGSQRFDPAGLSGRLIARWQTSGSYELFLDPIGPQQAAGFASAAADPPRQLALTIRLLDAAGRVTCQKQILFPPPVPRAPDGSNSALPQGPQQTASGDKGDRLRRSISAVRCLVRRRPTRPPVRGISSPIFPPLPRRTHGCSRRRATTRRIMGANAIKGGRVRVCPRRLRATT